MRATSEGAASHLPDDGGLIGFDGAEVDSVAVAPWAAMGAAMLGQFPLLAADPPGDVVGLLGVDRGQDAGADRSSELRTSISPDTAAICQARARSQTSNSSSSSFGWRTSRSWS
jgi:hypothetical protein